MAPQLQAWRLHSSSVTDEAAPVEPDPAAAHAAILEQISRYHMPYGMFGPKNYPPSGVPIYDLPAEYLAWFALKGFPEGRLGELLRVVYEAKANGCDSIFDLIRHRAGGRYKLRPPTKRAWKFE